MGKWRFTEDQAGLRLDQALAAFIPELGIRGRRRLIGNAGILLNGHAAKACSRVKNGDVVELVKNPQNDAHVTGAFLIEWQEPYCFFYKPSGLHTARVAASNGPSLEDALLNLLPEKYANTNIELLQRLDFGTSGIVAGALSPTALENYRHLEKEEKIKKYYLAFLEGRLEEPLCVDKALNTNKRRKSRVLDLKSDRKTFFTPLHIWEKSEDFPLAAISAPSGPYTLAGCRLSSGQRHQIRAHAACLGHPLIGDSLYGNGKGDFILQHFALEFPGCFIQLQGEEFLKNKLPAPAQEAINSWMMKERQNLPQST